MGWISVRTPFGTINQWVPDAPAQTWDAGKQVIPQAPAPTPAAPPPPSAPPPAVDPWAAQRAWEEERAKAQAEARRTNAFDEMRQVLSGFGIDVDGSFTNQLRDWVWGDRSKDAIMMDIRKTEAYNKRFTGMAELIKRGQFMDEATYISQERAYRNTLSQWGIPSGFYDDPTDFGKFIANGVSVKEVDDRVRSAKTFMDSSTPSEYRKALNAMGVSDGAILAHLLDADRAQSVIARDVKAASFAGAANQFGFDIDSAEAARYAATLGDSFNSFGADQRTALEADVSQFGRLAENQERLAFLDKDSIFRREDILDANLLNDNEKKAASERRAEREKNRFAGSSGFRDSSALSSGGGF